MFFGGDARRTLSPDDADRLVGVDPCILLAVLLPRSGTVSADERRASSDLVDALERRRLRGVTSTVAVAEVTYALGRERFSSNDRRDALTYLTEVLGQLLSFQPVTTELALAAAEFRLVHYHRDRAPISYADALYAVTAWEAGASQLVTVDGPLLALGDPRIVLPSALGFS